MYQDFKEEEDIDFYKYLAVGEGEASKNHNQSRERIVRELKYFQVRRAVTDQMERVHGLENAYVSEKIAGTLQILMDAEYMCFHGNEDINPLEFDGILRQIEKSKNPNIYDVRGKTIANIGDKVINEPSIMILNRLGRGNKLFMPPILVQDIQDLIHDRIGFVLTNCSDKSMKPVLTEYTTAYGTVVDFGPSAGGDRSFKVKGKIIPNTTPDAPKAPSALSFTTSTDAKSKFVVSDAGKYKYSVHSINRCGISVEKELSATVNISAGEKVILTITASTEEDETGYIICRSAKDGNELMEMTRIPRAKNSTITVFEDLNEDLPGTASLVLVTENKLLPTLDWLQLDLLRVRPLFASNRAETPFFIQLYGALYVERPEWCALVKNIQYRGGLKY